MTDDMSIEDRSRTMSRIRSRWTLQERLVHEVLGTAGIYHIMHPKIKGSPDLILPCKRIAVFLNGCFWHKCPICYRPPKSNQEYWIPKLERNVQRDLESINVLEELGWHVVIIWEHEIKKLTSNDLIELLKSKGIK